jgi:transcription antitermination factor NusG
MNYFNSGWYVVYTRPKQERKVAKYLEQKKIHHYLPTISKVSHWHDRKKLITTPLFPSYIFVMLKQMKEYYDVMNENSGFLYYVKSGGTNARVDEKIIEGIRLILDNTVNVECSTDYIQPGRDIVIRYGPFKGLNCQVIEHNNQQKVLVTVHLLNRYVVATLPVEYLR